MKHLLTSKTARNNIKGEQLIVVAAKINNHLLNYNKSSSSVIETSLMRKHNKTDDKIQT